MKNIESFVSASDNNQYGILASPQFPQYVAINPIVDSQCGQWRVDSHFEELPSSQVQVGQCLVIFIQVQYAFKPVGISVMIFN